MTAHDDVSMAGPRLAIRVAELIRLAHERSGLSHDEIATRLGVSVGRVSQILNGDGNFHIATVGRILAALDCTAEIGAFGPHGDKLQFRRRRTDDRRRGAEKSSNHDRENSSENAVHVYHMSLIGEVGGLDGLFVSTHKTHRQSLAGGHISPFGEPVGCTHRENDSTRATAVKFTTELIDA